MDREENLAAAEAVAATGVTVAAAKRLAEGLLEIAEEAMPITFFQTDSRVELARAVLDAPGTSETAAVKLVSNLDGTYGRSWSEFAAQLRDGDPDVPYEVSRGDLAALVDALAATGRLP